MHWRQPKVFISYRRDDSAVHARALYDELVPAFGARRVFFDVEVIDYGDRFAGVIDQRINACDVVVAVIGPRWLTLAGEDGQPRIQSPRDYVRREIEAALRTGKRLIPVLVGGAQLPAEASLPADIAALAGISTLSFSDRQIGEGADRLVDAIRGERSGKVVAGFMRREMAHRIGSVAALAMLFAAWLGLFDFFALDTKTASFTLWLADTVAPMQPSANLQIVVIDAETKTTRGAAFEGNPAARRDHAQLIRSLAQAGAKTLAFDVFVTTPSAADDAALVSAIEAARALKTTVVFGANGFDGERPVMVPAVRAAVTTWAVLCVGERLGYVRTVPLASQPGLPAKGSEARAVGLALAAANPGRARIAEGTRKVIVAGDSGIMEFPYSEIELLDESQPCQAGRAGDAVASALYRMPPHAALNSAERRLKYETVRTMDADALRRRFEGKTVLVGLELPGKDVFDVFNGWSSEKRHGLELHAAATSALLSGGVVQPLGWWGEFAIMAALGLFGSRLSQWQPAGSAWPRRALLLATLGACVGVALGLCLSYALLLNLTYPLGALWIGYWGAGRLSPAR